MPGRLLLVMGVVLLIAFPGFAQDAMVGGDEDGGVIAYASVSEYERATGRTMPAYSESPMLTALVDAGTLPPVEERLPDDPAVAVPLESVGVYGGTAKFDGTFFRSLLKRGLFTRDVNGAEIRTDLGMGFEVNEDYTQYRIFLRPGAKWSDGEDFTAADIMFWWNDQMNNDELTPHGPTWIWANAELSAVDDYTIQVDLSVPQPTLMASLSHPFAASRSHFFVAEHFQRQYHIDYNEDANKLASEQGFESWTQLYNHWKASWVFQQRPGIPTLNTWIVTEFTETEYLAERNPYFWQVDTAGNQLPYIDTLIAPYSGDAQTKLLRAIGGDLDYLSGFSILAVSDFPLMKENEAAGNYRVQTLKGDYQSAFTVGFNPVVKDPVLHDIFWDIRFRQALSLAIDRDALNESVFFGLATPRQGRSPAQRELLRRGVGRLLHRVRRRPRQPAPRRDGPGLGRRPQAAAAPRREADEHPDGVRARFVTGGDGRRGDQEHVGGRRGDPDHQAREDHPPAAPGGRAVRDVDRRRRRRIHGDGPAGLGSALLGGGRRRP